MHTRALLALIATLTACAPDEDLRRTPLLRVPLGPIESRSFDMRVVDFEGDGLLELSVVGGKHEPGPNVLYRSGPLGLLDKKIHLDDGADATFGIDFGDLDGDGLLDYVVANDTGYDNRICLQTLRGDFDCVSHWSSWHSRDIDLADLDGDGLLDMVFANKLQRDRIFFGGHLDWMQDELIGVGAKDDDPELVLLAFGDEDRPSVASTIGDIDHDGHPDVIVASRGELPTGVHLMGPEGPERTRQLELGTTRAVELVDVDADGSLDLVVGNIYEPNLVLRNLGDGHFDKPEPMGPEVGNTWAVAVADLDGDGWLDVVEANVREQDLIRYGTPGGGFGEVQLLGQDSTDTRDVVAADFDADGDIDIAVARYRQQDVIYLNQSW